MQGLYNLEEGGAGVCTNKTASVLFTLHERKAVGGRGEMAGAGGGASYGA